MAFEGQTYLTRYTFIQRLTDEGNTADWETFNFYYSRFIASIISRMGVNRHDCEDLSQEVLLKLWKNLNKFEPNQHQGSFRRWIARITRNTVYDFIRKQNSEENKRSTVEFISSLDDPNCPEEDYIEEEWKRNVTTLAFKNIAKKVPSEYMKIFCAFSEGKPVASLSEQFQLPEHKIYRYKKRVETLLIGEIQALKDFLE